MGSLNTFKASRNKNKTERLTKFVLPFPSEVNMLNKESFSCLVWKQIMVGENEKRLPA